MEPSQTIHVHVLMKCNEYQTINNNPNTQPCPQTVCYWFKPLRPSEVILLTLSLSKKDFLKIDITGYWLDCEHSFVCPFHVGLSSLTVTTWVTIRFLMSRIKSTSLKRNTQKQKTAIKRFFVFVILFSLHCCWRNWGCITFFTWFLMSKYKI